MRTLLIAITIHLLLTSCEGNLNKTILISPSENYSIGKAENFVYDNTDQPDYLNKLKASFCFEKQYFIASDSGIYVFDINNPHLKKYFKFRLSNPDSDKKLELLWVNFSPNPDNTKLLITTSSGQSTRALIFQVDLASLDIDWLSEFAYQIVASRYSNNGKQIAFGTSYNQKQTSGDSSVYYSSLFMINSNDGTFLEYFSQGESMEEIKFSNDDQYLYAVLGWPHVDTYVWNLQKKKEKIGSYGKDYTEYYDAVDEDKNSFVSIGSDGIYKWNLNNPEDYSILKETYINGSSKIFKIDELNQVVLIDYSNGSINPPTLKFFDSNWEIIDSLLVDFPFTNMTYDGNKITGLSKKDTIVVVDLKERSFVKVPLEDIQKLIKK